MLRDGNKCSSQLASTVSRAELHLDGLATGQVIAEELRISADTVLDAIVDRRGREAGRKRGNLDFRKRKVPFLLTLYTSHYRNSLPTRPPGH